MPGLSPEQIITHLAVATILGFAIYLSYWISHTGTVYSKKFNVSLIMMTVLSSTVMIVIGNNVALSLGMVGALSIVRYRTAIKDSRDSAYIFWAIIGGICSGSGDYMVGALGSAVVFVVMMFLGRVKNDNRVLLIIKGARNIEHEVESVVFKMFQRKANLKVKNTTTDTVEYIYELSSRIYKDMQATGNSITSMLYEKGQIEYANIITQNDEFI